MYILLIPEYEREDPHLYPGDIQPGKYEGNGIVELLREHADNPNTIRFIGDMLEE